MGNPALREPQGSTNIFKIFYVFCSLKSRVYIHLPPMQNVNNEMIFLYIKQKKKKKKTTTKNITVFKIIQSF